MNGQENRTFFNQKANEWDSIVYHDEKKLSMLVSLGGIQNGDSVLDIGSGTGVMLPYIRKAIGAYGRLVALDVAEKMLEISRRKNGSLADEYCDADFYNIEGMHSYNVIMAYSCFPHFGDRKRFFRKAFELLLPCGRLIIAHSESKEAINSRHEGLDVNGISSPLPPTGELEKTAGALGFTISTAQDAGEYYLVVLKKM